MFFFVHGPKWLSKATLPETNPIGFQSHLGVGGIGWTPKNISKTPNLMEAANASEKKRHLKLEIHTNSSSHH